MHPVLIQQLAADHIKEMHAMAAHEALARQAQRARRRAPTTGPWLAASYDPRLDAGQQPSSPPTLVMAGAPPESRDAG